MFLPQAIFHILTGGSADGDHRGWVIIEAANAEEAMMVVPSSHRPAAKVVKLTKFSRAQIEKMHIGQAGRSLKSATMM
jgi:hypothetical protein